MPKTLIAGTVGFVAVVFGLGLVLEPNLISSLPTMLHFILGAVSLALGAGVLYYAFK